MRSRDIIQFSLGVLLLVGLSPSASANDVERLSLDEKVARSDLVVIGHSVSAEPASFGPAWGGTTAEIAVDSVLKGDVTSPLRIYTRTGVSEQSLECCEYGKDYILFLVETPQGTYAGANGPYSAILLP